MVQVFFSFTLYSHSTIPVVSDYVKFDHFGLPIIMSHSPCSNRSLEIPQIFNVSSLILSFCGIFCCNALICVLENPATHQQSSNKKRVKQKNSLRMVQLIFMIGVVRGFRCSGSFVQLFDISPRFMYSNYDLNPSMAICYYANKHFEWIHLVYTFSLG